MKAFKLLFLTLFLTSCNVPSYYFREETMVTGVDFAKGKWLLNRIESSKETEDKLTEITSAFFKSKVGTRFNTLYSEKVLLPQNNKFLLNAEALKQIKTVANYDYFIQIKAGHSKNELGAVDLTPAAFNSNLTNEASLKLVIYDLNTQQIIYSKNAFGVTGNPEKSSKDITFSKSSNHLLKGCLQKILNDLDKKSIE